MSQKKSVLIVDDEADIRALLTDAFMKAGYQVDSASTGELGLTKIKAKSHFDIVIMDIKMPKMDGIEFFKQAKTISPRSVYVIFTGDPKKEKLFKAFQLGLTHVILKPTRPVDVAKEVESYFIKDVI